MTDPRITELDKKIVEVRDVLVALKRQRAATKEQVRAEQAAAVAAREKEKAAPGEGK